MPLECQRGKKALNVRRPDGDATPQLCGTHGGADGFRYSLSGLHLPSPCPLNLCSFQCSHFELQPDTIPTMMRFRLLRNCFHHSKGMCSRIFWHISLHESDTVLCNTLKGLSNRLVFLRQNISREFSFQKKYRKLFLFFFKQACIILFHALHELEAAPECLLLCRISDIGDLISNHRAVWQFWKVNRVKWKLLSCQ